MAAKEQAAEKIKKDLDKRKETIEYIEKELRFAELWLEDKPEDMEVKLRGKEEGLKKVLSILK